MAITTATFSTYSGQRWATGDSVSTVVSDDPLFQVNTQLTAWISAIGNPNWIRKDDFGGPYVVSSDGYTWFNLILNDGAFQTYGLSFMRRKSTASNGTVEQYRYADFDVQGYARGIGIENYSTNSSDWSLTTAGTHFIAFEPGGGTPWFLYSYKRNTSSIADYTILLSRLSLIGLAPGSYYPATGLSKWLLWDLSSNRMTTAQYKYGFPNYYGIREYRTGTLYAPQQLRYFYNIPVQYGDVHPLGELTHDILLSNPSMGAWGESLEINDSTYTCIRYFSVSFWVKSS